MSQMVVQQLVVLVVVFVSRNRMNLEEFSGIFRPSFRNPYGTSLPLQAPFSNVPSNSLGFLVLGHPAVMKNGRRKGFPVLIIMILSRSEIINLSEIVEKYQVKYTPRINHLKPPPIIGLMIFIMVIPGQKYDELINLRG